MARKLAKRRGWKLSRRPKEGAPLQLENPRTGARLTFASLADAIGVRANRSCGRHMEWEPTLAQRKAVTRAVRSQACAVSRAGAAW
jgi:hypothetical protein